MLLKSNFNSANDQNKIVTQQLLDNVNHRFRMIEKHDILAQTAYLDPRFKDKSFSEESSLAQCKDKLKILLKSQIDQTNLHLDTLPEEPHNKEANKNDLLWQYFDSTTRAKPTSLTSEAIIKLGQYHSERLISRENDPLVWWKSRQLLFPRLSEIAKKRFSSVATSVPSERIFSKAGDLVSYKRNRLGIDTIQELLFLNANLDKI